MFTNDFLGVQRQYVMCRPPARPHGSEVRKMVTVMKVWRELEQETSLDSIWLSQQFQRLPVEQVQFY